MSLNYCAIRDGYGNPVTYNNCATSDHNNNLAKSKIWSSYYNQLEPKVRLCHLATVNHRKVVQYY